MTWLITGMLTSAISGRGNNGLYCSQWLLLWNQVLKLSLVGLDTGKSKTQNPCSILVIHRLKNNGRLGCWVFVIEMRKDSV